MSCGERCLRRSRLHAAAVRGLTLFAGREVSRTSSDKAWAALPDAQWSALDPLQRRQHTLDGVKRLLLRESQVQPLLLVFEALHWIDSETQALLDELVESLPGDRVLLLVN
jgi:hypothetical protein